MYTMKESVAVAKAADIKKDFSLTKSDISIHRAQNEPERQLGSLRDVIGDIRRDGGTPSVDNIATELSSRQAAQRASVLLALQRTHGNLYVQRVVAGIQAKLKVGQPDDKYEQEADRVAAEVVRRMKAPQSQTVQHQEFPEDEEEKLQMKHLVEYHRGVLVQRPATGEGITVTPRLEAAIQRVREGGQISTLVQRRIEEEKEGEEVLQTKGSPERAPKVAPGLGARIQSLKGSGQPLPESVRDFFQWQFGHDFRRVRIHTDVQSSEIANHLQARAVTVGQDIAFAPGQYAPGTTAGRLLLAHELTHTIQQRSSPKISNIYLNAESDIRGHAPVITDVSTIQHDNIDNHVQRRIMMRGPTTLYGIELADEWNELTGQLLETWVTAKHSYFRENLGLARRIVMDMAATRNELRFDNERELFREVFKRWVTSRWMRISTGIPDAERWFYAFGYPSRGDAEQCGPRVNSEAELYWGPVQGSGTNYYFELSQIGRNDAYEALTRLFTLQSDACLRTLIHCDYLVSVIHFKAFADSIGFVEFNRRVRAYYERGRIGSVLMRLGISVPDEIPMVLKWNGFTDITLGTARSPAAISLQCVPVDRREDLIIGDHVLLHNHPMYDVLCKNVGGVWRLENAILVDRRNGTDLFQGHGYRRPVTEERMKESMRRHLVNKVTEVQRFILDLNSRSEQVRERARQELERRNVVIGPGGEPLVQGLAFYDIQVREPLRIPRMEELPGLYDPRPNRREQLFPVWRPVESR